MPVQKVCLLFILLLFAMLSLSQSILAQSTAFSYQGKLLDSGNPANGQYDLQFKLFDTATVGTGTQQGSTVAVSNVTVTSGVFTVNLDFGACPTCFDGSLRFLEIAVRPANSGSYTTLTPRQPITSTPYAIKSANAATAEGLSFEASANFIQNGTSQQTATNFNIDGNGTASGTLSGSIVNAVQQVNINGLRAFTVNGAFNDGTTIFTASNTFAGDGAGLITTPSGTLFSTSGKFNSFYGAGAGKANTTGNGNAFFGSGAGYSNTISFNNSFFGAFAGYSNTGSSNSFFGINAGYSNTTGGNNAFFGQGAGGSNTTGGNNAFFGYFAGLNNTTGISNTFIGNGADFNTQNATGNNNTLLGFNTRITSGITNSAAIGALASVTQSNSLVLGGITGINGGTSVNVGIGTTEPAARLHIKGASEGIRIQGPGTGADNAAFIKFVDSAGNAIGYVGDGSSGNANISLGSDIGNITLNTPVGQVLTATSTGNVGIGTTVPVAKLDIFGGNVAINNNLLLLHSGSDANHGILYSATVDGPEFRGFTGFRWTNGTAGASERMRLDGNGNLGIGTTAPAFKLHVNGETRTDTLSIGTYVSSVGGPTLCANTSTNRVGLCNSSLRYKTGVRTFRSGLDIITRLRPISFFWKESGMPDLGLAAEEVEKVEPLLTFRGNNGQIEGVKYNQLSAVFINAFKEQQAQIKQQQDEIATLRQELRQVNQQKEVIRQQQQEMAVIKQLLCVSHPKASICKAKSLK